MKRIAVCPGSYDPVTKGHFDLVCRARDLFGECEVVVMNNRDKSHFFSMEKRTALCRAAFENEKGIRVLSSEGMLWEYLLGREVVLVKGLRNETDFLYEREMARFNKEKCGVETLYLDTDPALAGLSSTQVRKILSENGDVSALMPENAVKLLGK